jgi:hypothetical protein
MFRFLPSKTCPNTTLAALAIHPIHSFLPDFSGFYLGISIWSCMPSISVCSCSLRPPFLLSSLSLQAQSLWYSKSTTEAPVDFWFGFRFHLCSSPTFFFKLTLCLIMCQVPYTYKHYIVWIYIYEYIVSLLHFKEKCFPYSRDLSHFEVSEKA